MEQTIKEMHEKIKKSSRRKLLRKQMNLLAEYPRYPGYFTDAPEASMAMVRIHKELIKTDCFFFMGFLVVFFAFLYFFKRFPVKRIKFIKR